VITAAAALESAMSRIVFNVASSPVMMPVIASLAI
jgi:hypothetical protein